MTTKNIPWRFSENPPLQQWKWTTEHFLTQIVDDGSPMGGVTWSVFDITGAENKILKTEQCNTFREAQQAMLEYVGKSWDKRLGYVEYAGDLIYNFEISTGKKISFKDYVGEEVSLTYLTETGQETSQGTFGVKNHSLLLRLDDGRILDIPPTIIKEIKYR
jgi:hypothetical protein